MKGVLYAVCLGQNPRQRAFDEENKGGSHRAPGPNQRCYLEQSRSPVEQQEGKRLQDETRLQDKTRATGKLD